MVRMKANPPKNSNGDDLSGDAWAAFATTAIMMELKLKNYLMGIIKDFDKFNIMSHALMKKNMDIAKASSTFDGTEEHLAAMVARAHNGGKWERILTDLKKSDNYNYVKKFLGEQKNSGDWYSIRCAESFGASTIHPGAGGKGIGGLEITPLVLN